MLSSYLWYFYSIYHWLSIYIYLSILIFIYPSWYLFIYIDIYLSILILFFTLFLYLILYHLVYHLICDWSFLVWLDCHYKSHVSVIFLWIRKRFQSKQEQFYFHLEWLYSYSTHFLSLLLRIVLDYPLYFIEFVYLKTWYGSELIKSGDAWYFVSLLFMYQVVSQKQILTST
jgi:hypothetical protein